jgi:SAM-dependent methyltransferase
MSARAGILRPLMKRMHAPIYEWRLRELVRLITPHLRAGDRVLDVGCGFGALGNALLDHVERPDAVTIRGLERAPRGNELIEMDAYDGGRMPYDDNAFDVVIVADVLHHEEDPDALIAECMRTARRLLIIKDHQRRGVLSQQRISLIDWAANAPYGVRCLYRYNTPRQWRESHERHGLDLDEEHSSMRLYPPVVNLLFGGSLQYMAVLRVPMTDAADA